jgi:hypothetical protein|tara:strand:- start:292 stop:1032 length:741 start_codon:yes stop_codon:yes gene_type:complete
MANIEFITSNNYLNAIGVEKPEPIKLNIPEWYKKLDHSMEKRTIKGCMPFLDALSAGYLLRCPQDLYFNYGLISRKGEPDVSYKNALDEEGRIEMEGTNLNCRHPEAHKVDQYPDPIIKKEQANRPILKILNPWIIRTPPGYSCLFTSPLNNHHYPWQIISGIVDTDTFNKEVNFPFKVNVEKIENKDKTFIINKGTPYVQIIPFKRENWIMKIKAKIPGDRSNLFYPLKLVHVYKSMFWNKKSWK